MCLMRDMKKEGNEKVHEDIEPLGVKWRVTTFTNSFHTIRLIARIMFFLSSLFFASSMLLN